MKGLYGKSQSASGDILEQERAIRTLSRSFLEDPLLNFITRQATNPVAAKEAYFRFCYRSAGRRSVSESGGVALWTTPNTPLSLMAHARLVPEMIQHLGVRESIQCIRLITKLDEVQPKDPHFYLMLCGVEPEARGKGTGSRLLHPTLDEADRHGVDCYLSTSNPRNHPFYERLGFKISGEFNVCPDAPTVWTMWREPGTSVLT